MTSIPRLIIADAGPLIAFGRVHLLDVLSKTLGQIIITDVVAKECLVDISRPGAIEIQKAIDQKLIDIHSDPQLTPLTGLLDILDPGEASAITLAVHLQAGILMDEKLGRAAAKKFNLKVIGTAGVLILAKKNQFIDQVSPVLEQLKQAGYFLSESLTKDVLMRVNEKTF